MDTRETLMDPCRRRRRVFVHSTRPYPVGGAHSTTVPWASRRRVAPSAPQCGRSMMSAVTVLDAPFRKPMCSSRLCTARLLPVNYKRRSAQGAGILQAFVLDNSVSMAWSLEDERSTCANRVPDHLAKAYALARALAPRGV